MNAGNLNGKPTMKGTSAIIHNFQKMDNLSRIFYSSHIKTERVDELDFFVLYDELLSGLKCTLGKLHYSDPQYKINLQYLLTLFKMMAYVRDQELGKGECRISYIMIFLWHKYYPLLAIWALRAFVGQTISGQFVRYGCWKDLKHICQYTLDMTGNENHSLIYSCIDLLLQQFKKDTDILLRLDVATASGGDSGSMHERVNKKSYAQMKQISLVAKWMPREKSAYGWLYEKIVFEWAVKYTPFMKFVDLSCPNSPTYLKAMNKARMIFRYLLSDMNQILCVTETVLCNGDWNNINLNIVNTRSFLTYKDAFLRKGESDVELKEKVVKYMKTGMFHNKVVCKKDKILHNFVSGKYKQSWIHSLEGRRQKENACGLNRSSKIHNIPFSYFVKKAFDLLDMLDRMSDKASDVASEEWGTIGMSSWISPKKMFADDFSGKEEIQLLNSQWEQYLNHFYPINEFVFPIVDIRNIRDETDLNYLYDAIGLVCLILHHPTSTQETEGSGCNGDMKRIIVIRHGYPEWLDIPNKKNFFETVCYIREYVVGSTEYESSGHYNILYAIDMLVDSITQTKMSEKNIERMVITIINDWNIEKIHEYRIHRKIKCVFESLFIQREQAKLAGGEGGAGVTADMSVFHMPHIIYWSVSRKNNCILPANCRTKRVTFFSGCNPAIMSHLSYIGLKAVRELTPYQTICNILSSVRYDIMETIFFGVFEKNSHLKIVMDSENHGIKICEISETI
jgi:hypothetical protein